MSEDKWYSSAEHFRTEESYAQYKKRKKKTSNKGLFGNLNFPKIKF